MPRSQPTTSARPRGQDRYGLPRSSHCTAGVCGTPFQTPAPAPSQDRASSGGPWREELNNRQTTAGVEYGKYVPVLTTNKRPPAPCHPTKAKSLVAQGKATFKYKHGIRCIILQKSNVPKVKNASKPVLQRNPGSRSTAMAITRENHDGSRSCVLTLEFLHRGRYITRKLIEQSVAITKPKWKAVHATEADAIERNYGYQVRYPAPKPKS